MRAALRFANANDCYRCGEDGKLQQQQAASLKLPAKRTDGNRAYEIFCGCGHCAFLIRVVVLFFFWAERILVFGTRELHRLIISTLEQSVCCGRGAEFKRFYNIRLFGMSREIGNRSRNRFVRTLEFVDRVYGTNSERY